MKNIGFLSDKAKDDILCREAVKLFKLDVDAIEKAKLKSIAANGDEQTANNLPRTCFVLGKGACLAQ